MFDLPVLKESERRAYRHFRKYLIRSGFLMLQQSIYCKLAKNTTAADAIISNIKKNKPSKGLVQILRITERQYSRMEYVVGEKTSEVLDSDDRLVIL